MRYGLGVQKTVEAFVRLGYLAKAIVYLLVGALALKVAAGVRGGRITEPSPSSGASSTAPSGSRP
jgi:hypothetical protein